ncbi:MAG: stage II sporulation protein M [Taibaiella sp.]|nr:stage II sporulation protein M [Taibaiella sp.]
MREGQFIKRNLERWESYQQPSEDPDEVARQFTCLVDDLSYAKTFYPGSNTIKYINGIAANIYLSIYRNKKEKSQRLLTFWSHELPLVIHRHHRLLLYTFLFFISFIFLGVLSAYADQDFVRAVLGDHYVDMTETNIANGEPFGVYNSGNELAMFLRIAFNNIKVAFNTYVFGITLGVGTLYLLFHNGLMIGVFEYMFFHHNLGFKSVMVVFVHGTLELWSIVVAGCAGLMLGNSILFPKTFTRMHSLKHGAKDSIKLIISLVPVFIVAAFFEGFVTRHTGMPLWLSLLILLASAAFIVWYYVIYPIKVARKEK